MLTPPPHTHIHAPTDINPSCLARSCPFISKIRIEIFSNRLSGFITRDLVARGWTKKSVVKQCWNAGLRCNDTARTRHLSCCWKQTRMANLVCITPSRSYVMSHCFRALRCVIFIVARFPDLNLSFSQITGFSSSSQP